MGAEKMALVRKASRPLDGEGVVTMDSQFWITAWHEGRTNFHQADFHDKLLEYFPQLNPIKGQRVLVPLCGKSKRPRNRIA